MALTLAQNMVMIALAATVVDDSHPDGIIVILDKNGRIYQIDREGNPYPPSEAKKGS